MNPKIKIARGEPHFFDNHYSKGLTWYKDRMPLACPDDIVMEKSPSYIYWEKVPQRIRKVMNDVKLIAIFADPVKRAISHWTHAQKKGNTRGSVRQSLLTPTLDVKDVTYINRGQYSEQLQRFYNVFPRNQILLLDSSDLVKNPVPLLNQVEDFLGLPRFISNKSLVFDESKGFFCKRIDGNVECESDNKGRKHPDVDKDVFEVLQRHYEPYNRELGHLTGKNFSFM